MPSLVSQMLTAILDKEVDESVSQLFVALHKSNLLTADAFFKVCFM